MTFFGAKNPLTNGAIGTALGGAFMSSRRVVGISMANPSVPMAGFLATTIGQFLVIGILAPLAEELLFRCILLSLFVTIIEWNFLFANVTQAGIFSIYHTVAYAGEISAGAYLSMSGAFVAAFIFGMMAGWLVKKFGLWAAIMAHIVINSVILFVPFVVIA